MKALVVFYSRTGFTKKIAWDLVGLLKCDIEEIIDMKDRRGAIGNLTACKDAANKKLTDIAEFKLDPGLYDLVIIGTPVWAFTMACAVRTYINANKDKFKEVAFFTTQGGMGDKNTYSDMEHLCAKKPRATLTLNAKEITKGVCAPRLQEFVQKLI